MPPPVAFLFPGQGSQSVGMGAALRRADPALFEHWMDRAEVASGQPIRRAVVEGPEAALTATDVAQPALLALSLAVAETAHSIRLRPAFVAGHSLGEYAAAVVAGALDADDALRLVAERGRLMAAAQEQQAGAMAVVLGLSPSAVDEICAQARERSGYVSVANINSPRQVVIAGNVFTVERAAACAVRNGARTALLPVGGAFHSLMMASVEARLGRVAVTMAWRDARVPLVSNADGRPLFAGRAIRDALVNQVTRPVQWTACMNTMVNAGCRHFLELGAGRVLTGLARQNSDDVIALAADGPAKLLAFSARLSDAPARAGAQAQERRLAS